MKKVTLYYAIHENTLHKNQNFNLSSNLYKIPEMETTCKKKWQQQNTEKGYIV